METEWPKIKIYENSWVAKSLGGERWGGQGQEGLQSWYVDGLTGAGTKCEDLCIVCYRRASTLELALKNHEIAGQNVNQSVSAISVSSETPVFEH